MGSLAAGILLAGCAGSDPSGRIVAKVDTVFRECPAAICPPRECPPPPDPRLRRVGAGIDTALWIALDSLAETDYLPGGGTLGAMVYRARDSQVVWTRQGDARMLPASVQKLWAAGAGLSELGPEFRWRTTLWAQGRIEGGVLTGNLVLEGGGDPTLGSADGPGLMGIANAVAKLGIREVRGNLVALDSLVGRGPDAWPQGWTISSSRDGYGSPVLGLNWSQNRVGSRAILEPRPEALKALRKALWLKKVNVTGTDTTVKVRGDSIGPRANWIRIGTVPSPRLDDVVRVCLRESVNPYAEAIVLALGAGRNRLPPRDAGRKRLQEWAARKGFEPSRMVLDDGSGLSRYNLVSARLLARMLSADLRGPAGERLVDFMPRGGSGTMRRRFKELPDPSVVVAKTGTLDGVSNLAGILVRPGRDTLSFAFLCSGYSGSARVVRKFQDRMLALLAGVPLRPIVPADTALDTASTDSVAAGLSDPVKTQAVRPDPAAGKGADSLSPPTVPAVEPADSAFLPPVREPEIFAPIDSSARAVPADLDSIRRHWSNLHPPPAQGAADSARPDAIDDLSSFPRGESSSPPSVSP